MFLETLVRRNPGLVRAAVDLHQAGRIPPNSYVLDLDAIQRNARLIKEAADAAGLRVYPMTKQVGRNPLFVQALLRAGMPKLVCVDWMEVDALARQGAKIGHVGHLVQIPTRRATTVAACNPEVWTVFNLEKAREVSQAAANLSRAQEVLLRVAGAGDTFYPTHDGGFPASEIVESARQVRELPHLRIAGVTSFPTLLFDVETRAVRLTPNMETITTAARQLKETLGLSITQVNAPGTTSAATMDLLAQAGATHVEPGHGFTGTTPWHAYHDLPELPAMCYVTEISDLRPDRAYVIGGGLYVDPVIPPYQVRACVGRTGEAALEARADAALMPPEGIDYYALLDRTSAPPMAIGDSVVFGFRAQAFVTRATIAPVRGLGTRAPELAGLYDVMGRKAG
jgi:predicted amino acid racemase